MQNLHQFAWKQLLGCTGNHCCATFHLIVEHQLNLNASIVEQQW
jgi:hypothetical protein